MDSTRYRNNNGNNSNNFGRGLYRRYSRSRSRSRERGRENYRNIRRNSRSRSRDRGCYKRIDNNNDNDLYRDIINQDYQDDGRNFGGNYSRGVNNIKFRSRVPDDDYADERYFNERPRLRDLDRDRDREFDNRDRRDRDRGDRVDRNDRVDCNDRIDRCDNNKRYGAGNRVEAGNNGNNHNNRRYTPADNNDHNNDGDSDENYENSLQYYSTTNQAQTPSNTIIVLGLQSHITEADIMSLLIQAEIVPAAIRLIRKSTTGASRGFAFVELNTTEEAAQWMEYTQGTLVLTESCHATMQYSHLKDWHCGKCGRLNFKRRGFCFNCRASRAECDQSGSMDDEDSKDKSKGSTENDWYCGQCGFFNFKRRDRCFKCIASRSNRSNVGEGSDEISNILTKKIMLRNLDVLTNEEGVLTAITQHAPELANKITKIFVSRDALTQTSRGICYLNFESLVDSMNMHNLLSTLEPPLTIDEKEVLVSYCVDHENRQIVPKKKNDNSSGTSSSTKSSSTPIGPMTAAEVVAAAKAASTSSGVAGQYTLDDVPRLAEYSASLYATTPAEHAHYLQYYSEYYIAEISSGSFSNIPSDTQLTEANSGAAVAMSAIQQKQARMNSIETTATAAAAIAAAAKASLASRASVVTPKGNDGKVYPAPNVSLYQYDETSGFYYDPSTGLYYDAHSQYYYNNETGAYLYWDQRKSTYILATPATVKADTKQDTEGSSSNPPDEEPSKKEKKESGGGNKHDKVKVAKKIVKDMEKWAKQLNQKKDYVPVAAPQPILTPNRSEELMRPSTSSGGGISSGYADVGFSILEKKATNKLATNFISPMTFAAANKLIPAYGSDSEDEVPPPPPKLISSSSSSVATEESGENEYVDFQKLTCLLCKRAFQSLDILQKHLKMSNLHKENLAKHTMATGGAATTRREEPVAQTESDQETALAAALNYRDRAKERRLKYGEYDPPPSNPSRERFEKEIKHLSSRTAEAPVMPIGSNNVGNRLLQKMGWSEGQGLGRKNQGRTNIIEASTRNSTAGLGTKGGAGIGAGCDYKTYIKKMMQSRYESA